MPLILAIVASCEAFIPSGPTYVAIPAAKRVSVMPRAGLEVFNDLVTGISDAISNDKTGFGVFRANGFGDTRVARASHILFSFADYPEDSEGPDGEAMANALKAKIENGDYTFECESASTHHMPSMRVRVTASHAESCVCGADVAEKFSACSTAEKGGDMGEFKRNEMVPEIDEAVFNVDEANRPMGSIVGPIKTTFGYHLVKVVERSSA